MTPRLPPAIGDGSIATPRIGTRSHIDTFTASPVFEQLGYSQTTYSAAYWYNNPMGVGGPVIGYGSVTVTEIPVPEPSTWAMMLLGFAGLGFLAYRKRAALAAA